MNSYLKSFTDPDAYAPEAKELGLKHSFIGIIERNAGQKTWVVLFYESKHPGVNDMVEMFEKTLGLNQKQSLRFLEHDLTMGDFE